MRCNWRRWLWGIIPLLMLSWVAIQAERPRIERELTDAAAAALQKTGATWAQVGFEGRDGLLSGKAWDEEDAEDGAAMLRAMHGVRLINNKASLIEKADTYVWIATRRSGRIRLSGYAPNVAARQAILGVTKANFPGHEVQDRMTLMRGVPSVDTWLGGVGFALNQLAAMRKGEVRLDDLGLTLTGDAEDLTSYRAIRSALANNPPKGIKITLDQLSPPGVSPYLWVAKAEGGKIELSGYFPDDGAHAELLSGARASGSAEIADRMQPGSGAPNDWGKAVLAATRALMSLQSGKAELKDATLLVSGVSADEATAEAVRNRLRADLPSHIKLTEQIRPVEVPRAPDPDPKPDVVAEPKPTEPAAVEPKTAEPKAPEAKAPEPKVAEPAKAPEVKPAEPPAAPKAAEQKVAEPKAAEPKAAEPKSAEQKPAEPAPSAQAQKQPDAPPKTPAQLKAEAAAKLCESNLAGVAKDGRILFETASAEIDSASTTTLGKLAAAVKTCPDMIVRIEGHTDIEGSPENNQALSLRRAQSVVDYMIRSGVERGQLESAGFGQTRPVAPNDTSENMAKNRRIEFAVRPK